MKKLRLMCIATVFASLLAVSVRAGDIHAGITDPPPQQDVPSESNGDISAGVAGDMHAGLTETIVTAVQSMLAVF